MTYLGDDRLETQLVTAQDLDKGIVQEAEVLPDLLAGLLIAEDGHALLLGQVDPAFQLRDPRLAEELEDMQIQEGPLELEPEDESVKMPAPLDERSSGALAGLVVFQRGDDERYDAEDEAAYLERRHCCSYGVLVLCAIPGKDRVNALDDKDCAAEGEEGSWEGGATNCKDIISCCLQQARSG